MPHDGWTLVHLRAASHGGNFRRNTHPFIINDRAVIHNGVWMEYDMAKLLLAAQGIHPRGETDTEVGANVIDVVGVRKFGESVTGGGVFMSLSRDGSLEIAKTSGDLMVNKDASGKVLIASELDFTKYNEGCETVCGYMKFGADGKYIKHVEKDVGWASTTAAADDTDDDEEDADDIGETGKTIRNFSKLLLQYTPPTHQTASGAHESAIIAPSCGVHAMRRPMMAGMGRCGGINSQYFADEGHWE